MIAAPPLSGCPLAKPATQNWRWPSGGKGPTIGSTVGIIMNHWGVSPCCTNPPVAKAHHRNDTKHQGMPPNRTLIPSPPRSSGVTIVCPTTASATHTHTTSQDHCAQGGRDTIDTCCAPGPDIATVWACPTPVYTRTSTRYANNTHTHTHNQSNRAVSHSDTHMSTKYRDRTTPDRNVFTAAQRQWGPVHHLARTHQADDQSKGRKGGVHQQRVLC